MDKLSVRKINLTLPILPLWWPRNCTSPSHLRYLHCFIASGSFYILSFAHGDWGVVWRYCVEIVVWRYFSEKSDCRENVVLRSMSQRQDRNFHLWETHAHHNLRYLHCPGSYSKGGFWPGLSKKAMLKTFMGILQDSHRHADMILFILDFENNNNNNKNGTKQGTFRSSVKYLK